MLKDKDSYPQLRPPTAALILENGETFWGSGLGSFKAEVAELCFNTSQTGYQETLTDPSYAKQIITFTFPHVGIVGTNQLDNESKKINRDKRFKNILLYGSRNSKGCRWSII